MNKCTLLSLFLCLFTTVAFAQNCTGNLIMNPGFESGLTSWSVSGPIDISSDARSGSNAIEMPPNGLDTRVYQLFPAVPGEEYEFSAYFKGRNGAIGLKFLTADWQPDGRLSGITSPNSYGRQIAKRVAPANTAWVEVSLYPGSTGSVLVDDVCLTVNGGNPPPFTCSISANNVSISNCNNRNTSDPNDDLYDWVVDVSATNGGTGYTAEWIENGARRVFDRNYPIGIGQQFTRISAGTLNLTLTDNANPNCQTTVAVVPPAPCSGTPPPPPGNGGDLVLTATGDANIAAWSTGIAYFEITNMSGETFQNVQVTFDFDQNVRLVGGNEYTSSAGTTLGQSWTSNPVWNVGTITAGGVKHVSLNVYSITNSPMEIYAQISQATGNDITSTPDNGTPPTVNEDDEVLWQINGGTPPPAPPGGNLPDLILGALQITQQQAVAPGAVLNYSFPLFNRGTGNASGNFNIKGYISTDDVLSNDDIQDGIIPTGNIAAGQTILNIPGASTIPSNIAPGQYYLILVVDADNQINEEFETNNQVSRSFFIDCVCPAVFDPVCGSNGVSYSNACEAECDGVFNYTPGDCSGGTSCAFIKNYTPSGFNALSTTYEYSVIENANGFTVDYKQPDVGFPFTTTTRKNGTYQLNSEGTVVSANEGTTTFSRDIIIETVGNTLEMVFVNYPNPPSGTRVPLNFGALPAGFQALGGGPIFKTSNGFAINVRIIDSSGGAINRIVQTNNQGVVQRVDEMPDRSFYSGFGRLTEGPDGSLFAWYTTSGNNTLFGIPANGTAWDYRVLSDTPSADWVDTRVSNDGQWVITSKRDNQRSVYARINVQTGVAQEVDLGNFLNVDFPPGGFRRSWMRGAMPTDDGGVLVSTFFSDIGSAGAEERGLLIGKLNANANIIWRQKFLDDGINDVRVKPIAETLDGGYLFAGTEQGDRSLFIKTTNTGALIPLCGGTPPPPSGNGPDLDLSYSPFSGASPAQWSFFGTTLTLTNNGNQAASSIEVSFTRPSEAVYKGGDEFNSSQGDFQHWGDEIWRVGTLAPGQTATIDVNYFRLSGSGFSLYAQVSGMNETDSDSTPNNGTCCTASEDDEASMQFGNALSGNVTNRTAIAENLGNEIFAIINASPNPTTGRFNVEVYSNENQTSEITVVDILGKPVFRKTVELNEGHNTIPIDLENRGTGMMMVKMTPFHPYLRQIRVMKVRD